MTPEECLARAIHKRGDVATLGDSLVEIHAKKGS